MEITPEMLEQVYKKVQETIDGLKVNKDWSASGISGQVDILQATLVEVEKTANEVGGLPGEQKKKLAVEIINKIVDIPVIPEWVEAKIIEYIIDIMIGFFNKHFSHAWIKAVI